MEKEAIDNADVLLVGYENQENLGLRSIIAYLRSRGFSAYLSPFRPGPEKAAEILDAARSLRPRVMGFSIIFQYSIEEFGELMRFLRENGIEAHFTAGGHFPSLRPESTLELLPALDSVVRFEGEYTLSELLGNLDGRNGWEGIEGLAFRRGSSVVINPPRPFIRDLDDLPPVYRDPAAASDSIFKSVSMLASRGCLFNCSFCSIRQFYSGSTGALRRSRSPRMVVNEMRALHEDDGVEYFSFQDDDFAARSPSQRAWLDEFLRELSECGLAREVRWKIACRVDDLDEMLLSRMRDHGLIAVYLGVESGSERGLKTLNKSITVKQNLSAIDMLKRFDMAMSMGFMLFDPSSTFETVRENIGFLREVGNDGYFPVNFCKMLPYAGTPIEAELRAQGRLRGTVIQPDYSSLDPRMDWYQFFVQQIFTKRNFHSDGLVNLLQEFDFLARLKESLGRDAATEYQRERLTGIIAASNRLMTDTLGELLDYVETRGPEEIIREQETIIGLGEKEWRGEARAEAELRESFGIA
jgi:anaerobic magnesium-protoporphyrin IX monomethyl ester cyclase